MANNNRIDVVGTGTRQQVDEWDNGLSEEVRMLRQHMAEMYQAWIIEKAPHPPPPMPPVISITRDNKHGKNPRDELHNGNEKVTGKVRRDKITIKPKEDLSNMSHKESSVFLDIRLPVGFEMPNFNLYDGIGDPVIHLRVYCDEMKSVRDKDDLLVAYFNKSLTGAALEWHNCHDVGKWPTLGDMAQDFVRHFRCNKDITPNCSSLSQIEKKPKESFKDLWLKWNEQVARDDPVIDKTDAAESHPQQGPIIVLAKPVQPQNKFQTNSPKNTRSFVKPSGHNPRQQQGPVVVLAKSSQPQYRPRERPQIPQKPPHLLRNTRPLSPLPSHSQKPAPIARSSRVHHFQALNNTEKLRQGEKQRQRDNFTPIGESYTSLFEKLKRAGLIKPLLGYTPDPKAKGFNPTVRCMCHSNVQRHNIEDCRTLKREIERMIREGIIMVSNKGKEPAIYFGNLLIKVNNILGNIDVKLSG